MSDARRGGLGRLLTGVVWATLLLAVWLASNNDTTEGPTAKAPKPGGVAIKGHSPAQGLPPAHEPVPGADPKSLVIKAMGLTAPIEAHGLDPQGGVEAPPYDRPGSVAWYRDGPRPGSAGAAVLVGHVDTKQSSAVFFELRTIKRGTTVSITRTDGSTADFTVEDVSLVANDHFNAEKEYGPRDPNRAELHLITCGGDYDRAHHGYKANVVVSAYLTSVTQPPQPPKPATTPANPPAPAQPPAPPAPPSTGPDGTDGHDPEESPGS
ncbi:hypothetical protein FHS39_004309 [Streptomyces olivoverticillatus]|uniref:Class F sortase n=1 Tax=Streptomyces olivoverticillatus TaxID=66427 RepID=A0A7W7LS03_9ACTN|nr:class F sortase [Streptomyces olivoverticillatus]MBB4895242.1 hypothetical protein [Streptomyces olivoverticillatus]